MPTMLVRLRSSAGLGVLVLADGLDQEGQDDAGGDGLAEARLALGLTGARAHASDDLIEQSHGAFPLA